MRERGDAAVRDYSEKFDNWSPESFRLGPEEIERIVATVPGEVLDDLRTVQANVRTFAQHQLESMRAFEVETQPGVFLGQKHLPIAATGAYIPGGRYPLTASAHMTVVTAKVAGVERVTACTPPIRGEIPGATIAAMHLAGADEIFLLGGVQAVAAMSVGTQTIGKVDLLAGPGNAYVAEAKRQLFGEVGIDLFAGPTEILVVADDTADPFVVAVDLLSQAEHGPDSPAVLITTSEEVARAAMAHIDRLLPEMPTNDMAGPAWRDHGQVHVVDDLDEAYRLADSFASEHVQILTGSPARRWRRCTTTARSSSARAPACPTATSASAPTTCCRPAAPRGTPAGSGSGSTCAPSPTRRSRTGPRARPSVSSAARVAHRALRGTRPVRRRPGREVRRRPLPGRPRSTRRPALTHPVHPTERTPHP